MQRRYTRKQRSELVELVPMGRATVTEAAARLGVTPVDGILLGDGRGSDGASATGAVPALWAPLPRVTITSWWSDAEC